MSQQSCYFQLFETIILQNVSVKTLGFGKADVVALPTVPGETFELSLRIIYEEKQIANQE